MYDAYDGPKEFVRVNPWKHEPKLSSQEYALRVSDEYVTASPGKCIHIGHGFMSGKTVGLDQPHPYHRKANARLIDYFITTSEVLIQDASRASGVPANRVLPLGLARTDAYIGKKKGDGGTPFANRRCYLFLPTYRGKEELPYPEIDWDFIDSRLSDEEVFVVKPHMMVTWPTLRKQYRHIVEISSAEPSAPYLYDSDVVITDYSSVLFDAYLLKKPVVLFAKDVEHYQRTRGLYFDYPSSYSSRYCTNELALVNLMQSAYEMTEQDKYHVELFASACDGHATERIIELIRRSL